MSEQPRKSSNGTKTQLALAVAQGVRIAAWARTNGVPRRTAFRWAKEPDVRKAVEAYRRRTIDLAVGRMTKGSSEAAELILKIAHEADTYAVRLRAARAVLSDMIKVAKFSGIEERMTAIEDKLDKRDAAVGSRIWSPAPANYGQGATPP
jgi:hypothetical protein